MTKKLHKIHVLNHVQFIHLSLFKLHSFQENVGNDQNVLKCLNYKNLFQKKMYKYIY